MCSSVPVGFGNSYVPTDGSASMDQWEPACRDTSSISRQLRLQNTNRPHHHKTVSTAQNIKTYSSKDYHIQACDNVKFGKKILTHLRNMVPTLRLKRLFCPEKGGTKFLWNTDIFRPDYRVSRRRRQWPSYSQLWQSQISQASCKITMQTSRIILSDLLLEQTSHDLF